MQKLSEKGNVYLWLVLMFLVAVSFIVLWPQYFLNQMPEDTNVTAPVTQIPSGSVTVTILPTILVTVTPAR